MIYANIKKARQDEQHNQTTKLITYKHKNFVRFKHKT